MPAAPPAGTRCSPRSRIAAQCIGEVQNPPGCSMPADEIRTRRTTVTRGIRDVVPAAGRAGRLDDEFAGILTVAPDQRLKPRDYPLQCPLDGWMELGFAQQQRSSPL